MSFLRGTWVPSFASLCLDMYSQLFNMNKCCLKKNLKEKSTRSQWEARWESLVPFCFCRHDFKRARQGECEGAELWKKRSRKRGRGWIYIARRSRKKDRKSDRVRDGAWIIITRVRGSDVLYIEMRLERLKGERDGGKGGRETKMVQD